ncbi:MAG TPA: hypothetical protein VLI46_01235 [Ramlibacter sp.]|nr:hypothetical protein [Ramlibacter sp.]
MSASSAPALRAIAFQLAQALDRYQQDFDDMAESRGDTGHYRQVTRELHDIRAMKGVLPQLSEEMAEVLLRHVELVHSVWDAQIRHAGEATDQTHRLRVRHRAAVDAMRRKCVALSGEA